MKVLVTGGTGFTGSHLVKKLISRDINVRVLVRPAGKIDTLKELGAEIVTGDIVDKDSVFKAVDGTDGVFHIAAAFREANLPDKAYWDINYGGTKNIIEACLKYKIPRLVHCSTIGVTSSVKNPPADETTPYSPGDVYQESKCKAEKEVLKYIREKNLPASIIRPCAIYGPGDFRLFKMFKMIAKKRFLMLGKGNALFHMVYIDDLVNSFISASEKRSAVGEIFIIGGEKYTTLNELTGLIAKEFDVPPPKIHLPYKPVEILSAAVEYVYKPFKKEPPLYRRRVAFFKKNRAFDISKAKELLGYSPEFSLERGIHATAKWYTDNGYIKNSIAGSNQNKY